MRFNRGEWSELYAVLDLIDNQELNVVNDSLEIIDDSTFKVLGLYISSNSNEYYFNIKDIDIDVFKNNKIISNVQKNDIKKYKEILLNKILKELPGNGSFEISEMKSILTKLTEGNKIKSSANSKADININLEDNKLNTVINKIGYSIKSSLGSPATLLNASNNTNFKYLVEGLTQEDIVKINSIKTRTKLLDRLKYMKQKGAKISFNNVKSDVMNRNLQMIDSKLPEILAELLILSYEIGEKNIEKLLYTLSERNVAGDKCNLELYYKKKLGDFLLAIALGMMPGELWNGAYDAKGGIILVESNGKILVLDAIYYKEYLVKYLIKNTKLESPSSSRYKMFEMYSEDGKIYFNLNLQIRFIK